MKLYKLALAALALATQTAGAQSLQLDTDETKAPYLMTSQDTVTLAYHAGFTTVPVLGNVSDYTVSKSETDAEWISYRKESNGNLTVFADYYYDAMQPRFGSITLTTPDGSYSRRLTVKQNPNTSAEDLGDVKHVIASGKADSEQNGEGIANSFDDNTSTIWHSSWGGCTMPTNVQFTFKAPGHVDYMLYTPRTDSQNGRWGEITVYYATKSAPTKFVKVTDADCEMSWSPTRVDCG